MNIVWKRPDGGVSVTHLTQEAESTHAEAEKLKARGDIPADWECVCHNAELPEDRHFREAWAWLDDAPRVNICPVKAKEVTKQRLRHERAALFAETDLAFQRAIEDGDEGKKSAAIAEKRRLRDVTKRVDAVPLGDLDALRALSVTE